MIHSSDQGAWLEVLEQCGKAFGESDEIRDGNRIPDRRWENVLHDYLVFILDQVIGESVAWKYGHGDGAIQLHDTLRLAHKGPTGGGKTMQLPDRVAGILGTSGPARDHDEIVFRIEPEMNQFGRRVPQPVGSLATELDSFGQVLIE